MQQHEHYTNGDASWVDFDKLLAKHFPQLRDNAAERQWIDLQALNAPRFQELRSDNAITTLAEREFRDFVYWKRFEVIEFNIFGNGSSHQLFMGQLYQLELMLKNAKMKAIDDAESFVHKKWGLRSSEESADAFISEGHGFFMSSASGYGPPCITIGEDYIMSSTEKMAFKGFNLRRI